MKRKLQSNLKNNRSYKHIREDKDKMHNNRFEPLSDNKESDKDSDLTLSNDNMR
jgi:hypothetical protein